MIRQLILWTFFLSLQGWVMASPVVSSIKIQGNKRIEKAAIEKQISSQKGKPLDLAQVKRDVLKLFDLGYFYDIQVEEKSSGSGVELVYTVVEKPVLSSIAFKGNDEFEEQDLLDAITLKPFEVLDYKKLKESESALLKLYEDKGYFLAKVGSELGPEGENGDRFLEFLITENDQVQVKEINIIGNKNISSEKLKSIMQTREEGFFSFMSDSGSYKQESFDRDLQVIDYFYRNEGYVKVKVDPPQVFISPDKKNIFITIRVNEGDRYKVGSIGFSGDLLFDEDELKEEVELDESEYFSIQTMQKDMTALKVKYGDLGYAYTNVIPRNRIHDDNKTVDIIFDFEKGEKVYINEINVKNNTKTRDKVVRRELKIQEGDLYNETLKRESLDNVRRLGFFEPDLRFETKTPKGRHDLMDIDVVVKERNTGTIQAGAGYSSFNGLLFNLDVKQKNFLGRGQDLGASLQHGGGSGGTGSQTLFNLSFVEPYFLDSEWSLTVNAYHRSRGRLDYDELKTGGSFSLGHPLAPYWRASLGYKLDHTKLTDPSDPDLYPVDTANGMTSALLANIGYDKRNDRYSPTKGIYSLASVEYAGLGGDLSYIKGLFNFRFYRKIFWDVVWRHNLNYGIIQQNGSGEPPFNQLFLLGGATSLRGYEWFSVGRKKSSDVAKAEAIAVGASAEEAEIAAMRPFGGEQQIYYNMEFQFPLLRDAGILGVAFFDVGYADNQLNFEDLKSNYGFGFRWFSPLGPLRFEWGFPINPDERFGEGDYEFQFAIGPHF